MKPNNIPYPSFHIMAKPIGPICNIDCKNCFYLEKENLYKNKFILTFKKELFKMKSILLYLII